MKLTDIQIQQLLEREISIEQIEQQIKAFKEGFPYVRLHRPAKINDGIIKPTEHDLNSWIKTYDSYYENIDITKFVPASGAASRMFKSMFDYYNTNVFNEDIDLLLSKIEKFPFYNDLHNTFKDQEKDINEYLNKSRIKEVVEKILFEDGLNYGYLPKGLLKFHNYLEGARTAVEEHLIESIQYAKGKNGVKLHFTIPIEHEQKFKSLFAELQKKHEKNDLKINITYSFQKKSTDTIAVDLNNNPLIDKEGKFVFRPGGHGALLENLNDLNTDLIFIKNIDNISPDHLKSITIKYKKALAGLLIRIKKQIEDFLTYLEWHDAYTDKRKHEIAEFIELYLGIKVRSIEDNSIYAGYIKSILDKPIRICGMVKNTGEPGGGPFWVYNKKGELSLQIIESSQVDLMDSQQRDIFYSATHFNPVDIVCCTKDYAKNKYNLLKYRDNSTGFITEKSYEGEKIKVQELPGLWNGGMAHWITIFVEVPIETFTPVKTFTDWLRNEHQSL